MPAQRLQEPARVDRHDRQRNDRQAKPVRRALNQADLLLCDRHRFSENIHRIEADTCDVIQASHRIHPDLLKSAINDPETHLRIKNEKLGN